MSSSGVLHRLRLPAELRFPVDFHQRQGCFNAVGVGAFFNVMNFGQMLMCTSCSSPSCLSLSWGPTCWPCGCGGGSSLAERATGAGPRAAAPLPATGRVAGPQRRYDIVKEATVASSRGAILVVALASLLSSPDVPPSVTIRHVGRKSLPADFIATAVSELAGTSETAQYGPRNNNQSAACRACCSPGEDPGVRYHRRPPKPCP